MTTMIIPPSCSPQRDTSHNFTSTATACRAPTSLPFKTIIFLIFSVGIWPERIFWHGIVAVKPLDDVPFNGFRLHDDRHFSWEQGQDGTGKSNMGPVSNIWNSIWSLLVALRCATLFFFLAQLLSGWMVWKILGVVKISLWVTLGMKGSTSSCTWPVLLTLCVTLTLMLCWPASYWQWLHQWWQ